MLKFSPKDVIKRMRRDAREARQRSKDDATHVYFGMYICVHNPFPILLLGTKLGITADTAIYRAALRFLGT